MKRKFAIITLLLLPESSEKANRELESEIEKALRIENIPWAERIGKITVLRES